MIVFIVLIYFVFIFLFILRISTMTRKLNNLQESNSIEQNKRFFKFIIVFYRLCVNKECFVAIETYI